MVHIYERCGVLLHVEYTPGADGIPTFQDVRVTDGHYRPVGPNLLPLMHDLLVLTDVAGSATNEREAETVLSSITGELQCPAH